jgi:hypothetical protein
VTIRIDSIFQDEPVDGRGDGRFSPDGKGVGTDTARVRAERSGSTKVSGNGRVYHIRYTADDGQGGSCSGDVEVGVPPNRSRVAIDDGANFDSTLGAERKRAVERGKTAAKKSKARKKSKKGKKFEDSSPWKSWIWRWAS